MKNKMRLFLSTICTLLLMSCVNLVGDDNSGADSSGGKCTITGTITLSGASRTAVPDLEIADYFYEVKATNDAVPPEEVDGIVDAVHHTFSITLADGNWDITVNGYQSQVGDVFSNKLLTTTNSIVVANNGVSAGSLTFKLKMIQTPANPASSTVELPIKVDSSITDVEAIWQESGVEKIQTVITNGASTTANFTMKADGASSNTATSGNYPVVFKFYSTVNGVKVLCYSLVETVALYDYLPTNSWLNNTNAPYITLGIMNITSNILRNFDYEEFYVSSTGNNKNSGGFFDPFASVQSAVSIVQAIANPEVEQYTIYLMDDITLAPDYTDWPMQSDGVTPEDSYVTINPSSSLKIKITSYGEPATPYKIDANRSAANPGRVMYVGEKAEVTLENITITGGCSHVDGAGIYINNGSLYLIEKASVSYNKMTNASTVAAGVYNANGLLSLGNGSEISYNGDESVLQNAGGVYSNKGKFYMEPGAEVHHNIANSGAGLKFSNLTDGYIHGGKIYSNEIKGASGNGGGIFVSNSTTVFEIKDAEIYSNKAYRGAGILAKNVSLTGSTLIKENEAYDYGGGILFSEYVNTVSGSVVFENNIAPKGSAIYIENKVAKNELSDSFKFINTTELQTIFLEYDTSNQSPVITLGDLNGLPADQKINLIIKKKADDTSYIPITFTDAGVPIIAPANGTVDLSQYTDNIKVLNEDLTPSNYEIDDEGKLKSNIVIGPNGGFASSAYADVVPFGDGTGITTAGNYSISTKEELTAFATWATTTTSTNYTFVLYDNIDLEGVPFSPIGGTKAFGGTFDGNGNKIKNLKINSASGNAALFGKVGANATVKNLYVHGEVKGGGANVAGIVSEISVNTGRIDNCVSDVTVSTSSGSSVGGICGSAKGMITNCVNIGSVTGSASGINVGGICGSAELSVYNSANFGTISGFSSVGGIVGTLTSYQTIGNCYNYGVISSTQTNNRGAIEGNGTLSCIFEDLYYHANSSVSKAIAGDNYPSVGENFTDPDALRSTLNTNLLNPAYSTLSLAKWNYDYKIDGVKYPVCTTFALPEKIGVNLSDLASAPSDNSVPYIMKTQSDIEKLAGWVNSGISFAGFEFKIPEEVSDIALSGSWTPVGTSANPFKGTFDGGNVNISSVAISGGKGSGFFGYVENATIRNVKLDGSLTVTDADCGGLVGSAKGNILIENCDIKLVVNGGSYNDIGGILGYYDGDRTSNITIRNCINRSNITGSSNVGGIVGLIYSTANSNLNVIENCANYGGVTGTGSRVGGIAGSIMKTQIENCLCNPTNVISGTTDLGNVCGNASTGSEVNYCYYLTYNSTEEKYCGNETVTPVNCNIFRVMDTKYQVYNAGNSVIGTYPADADLCDIMNDWVNDKNTTVPGYLSWKYESSLMEFIE